MRRLIGIYLFLRHFEIILTHFLKHIFTVTKALSLKHLKQFNREVQLKDSNPQLFNDTLL